jgi:hypothetical protein
LTSQRQLCKIIISPRKGVAVKTRFTLSLVLLLVGNTAGAMDIAGSPDPAGGGTEAFPSLRHRSAQRLVATLPGEFEIAPYGEPEDLGAYRFDGLDHHVDTDRLYVFLCSRRLVRPHG